MKRVLITGGAGFIGSHLTKRLIAEGLEVALVELEGCDTVRIKDVLDKIKVYGADLADTKRVADIMASFKPDGIFHLATYYAVEHRPDEIHPMIDANVKGTVNLLEAASACGVKLFVNTSSGFVYRPSRRPLREKNPLWPVNLYATTKIYSEGACSYYAQRFDLQCVTLRIFSPYGPGDHKRRLIPSVTESFRNGEAPKMTSGRQRWDFVYVDDIVDAYLRLIKGVRLASVHEVFNIGSGRAVSVREIALKIKEILGSGLSPEWGAIPDRKNELMFMCANVSKAKKVLGWEPKVRILKEGLKLVTGRNAQ